MIIDLDKQSSAQQQDLVRKYYRGFIPHVAVLDEKGNAVYNQAGEVGEPEISRILDALLKRASK